MSCDSRRFVLVGSRQRARHRRLRPELYKLTWNVDLMEKLLDALVRFKANNESNNGIADTLELHRERWIKSIKSSRLFMRQSLELCVTFSAFSCLDRLLSMIQMAVLMDVSDKRLFWTDLFSSLLTLAVERDDVTTLRRLLNMAHNGDEPRLRDPINNCTALVTACNGNNARLIKVFVDKGYRLRLRMHNTSLFAVLHELSAFSGGIGDASFEASHNTAHNDNNLGNDSFDIEENVENLDELEDHNDELVSNNESAEEGDAVHTLYLMRAMTNVEYIFACYEMMANTCPPNTCTCLNNNEETCSCPLSEKFEPCDHSCLKHLECSDPMYLYLELSRMCRELGRATLESSAAFATVADTCDEMSVCLLDLCQDAREVDLLLSMSVGVSKHFRREHVRKMTYPRLHVAVHQQHRALVAHVFSQQLLRQQWLGRVTQWPKRSVIYCSLYVIKQCLLTPFYVFLICLRQLLRDLGAQRLRNSRNWPKRPKQALNFLMGPTNLDEPLNRFISYSCSYLIFYVLLIISITAPVLKIDQFDAKTRWYHLILLGYTISMVAHDATWARSVRRFTGKIQLWRLYDLLMHTVLCASFVARFTTPDCSNGSQQCAEAQVHYLAVSNSLLSVTTIMAGFRFLYWLQLTDGVGPIIVSLTRVVKDLLAFLVLYLLLGLAFTSGLAPLAVSSTVQRNRLEHCNSNVTCVPPEDSFGQLSAAVFWSMGKTFFWMIFSPDPPEGLFEGSRVDDVLIQLMFAVYTTLAVIVLLNLMIAVMNATIGRVQDRQLLYWKFERTSVWMSFLSSESILPIPFNVLLAIRSVIKGILKLLHRFGRVAVPGLLKQQGVTRRQLNIKARQRERYEQLMLNIIKRYRKTRSFPEHKRNDDNNGSIGKGDGKSNSMRKEQDSKGQ